MHKAGQMALKSCSHHGLFGKKDMKFMGDKH